MHLKSVLLPVLGFLFLGLGTIGIVLPIWPTTPFILVAAACFSGSPRIRAKILKIKFFREHIDNYENRSGLPTKTVVKSLSFLWSMLLVSMLLLRKLWLVILLAVVGTCVTIHILSIAKPKHSNDLKK